MGLGWQTGYLLLGERLPWLEEGLPLVVKVLQLTTLYAALLARVGKMRSPSLEEELEEELEESGALGGASGVALGDAMGGASGGALGGASGDACEAALGAAVPATAGVSVTKWK